jgi:1,4-dihydroxy-2-naphthoyl-CoA synthase
VPSDDALAMVARIVGSKLSNASLYLGRKMSTAQAQKWGGVLVGISIPVACCDASKVVLCGDGGCQRGAN